MFAALLKTGRFFGLLLAMCWGITLVTFAQPRKPDVIVKTDERRISCRIIGADTAVIRYTNMAGTASYRINKTAVSYIVYSNGKVVSFIKKPTPPIKPPTLSTLPQKRISEFDEIIADLEKGRSIQGRIIRLHPIFFDTGSNAVLPQSYAYLDSIARFLVKIPALTVEISGYTDNTGNALSNRQLSHRRADAVRNYLVVTKEIASHRIEAMGYGQAGAVASNQTEQGRATNRRVELKFLALTNQTYVLHRKDGQRIETTFVLLSNDNQTISYRVNSTTPVVRVSVDDIEFITYPDGSRHGVDLTEIIEKQGNPPPTEPTPKKVSFQINALPTLMLGGKVWSSLPNGYGHTFGGGASAQVDYWLTNGISMGAELGYSTWRTQVNLVENPGDLPYYTYSTSASQFSASAHLRVKLGSRFYLMPQGGAAWLQVAIQDAENKVSFDGLQTTYGGAIGCLIPLGRTVHLDAGLFYRAATPSKSLKTEYGVEPMQYAGVRLGFGFSH
ncbi:hypothetical protein GCM10028805_37720 [Spirosoma harenae]